MSLDPSVLAVGGSEPAAKAEELSEEELSDYEKALRFEEEYKFAEARKSYQQALDSCEKALGKNNIATLEVARKLAQTYQNEYANCYKPSLKEAIYDKALAAYTKVLISQKEALGAKHRETLRTIHQIATLYNEHRDYPGAVERFQEALDGQNETLGEDDADTVTTLTNMADCLDTSGDHEKAQELYEQALGAWQKKKDAENLSIEGLEIVFKIGEILYLKPNYPDALACYRRYHDGLIFLQQELGTTYYCWLILEASEGIARTLRSQGNLEQALEKYREIVAGYEAARDKGISESSLAENINSMSELYYELGQYQEALKGFEKLVAIYVPGFTGGTIATPPCGSLPRGLALPIQRMASIYCKQGNYERGVELYGRSLDCLDTYNEEKHDDTLAVVDTIADILFTQKEYTEALKYYERAFSAYDEKLGKTHQLTIAAAYGVASSRGKLRLGIAPRAS